MASNNLDLIVDVIVTRDTPPLSQQDFNSAMFVTDDQVFSDRYRTYTSAASLLEDGFSSDSVTYAAVLSFFSQGGRVNEITIGRRDATGATIQLIEDPTAYTTYSLVVQGVTFSYTTGAAATAEEVLDALQGQIAADATVSAEVIATSFGSSDYTDLGAVDTRAITPPNDPASAYTVLVDTVLGTPADDFVGQDNQIATVDGYSATATVGTRAITPPVSPADGDLVLVDTTLGTPTGDFVGYDDYIMQYDLANLSWTFVTPVAPFLNSSVLVSDESDFRYTYDGAAWKEGVNWSFGTTIDNDSVTVTDETNARYIYDSDTTSWAEGSAATLQLNEISTADLTLAADLGNFVVTYIGQEDWADALANISEYYSNWYVLMTHDHTADSIVEIAAEVQGNYTGLYFASSQNAANLETVAVGTSPSDGNVIYRLQELNYDRSACAYSATADSTYLECAWVGERVWTLPGASIWDLSAVSGVVSDSLTRTQINLLESVSGNYFTNYGGIDYVRQGKVSSGEWVDTIRGGDNLASDIQIELVRTLGTAVRAGSKIPLTDAGVGILKQKTAEIVENYVSRGFIKDTVTEEDTLGNKSTRRGYFVYSDLVSNLTSNQRASRQAPDIQVVADLAGAVQYSRVLINLYV